VIRSAILAVAAVTLSSYASAQTPAEQPSLRCDVGPVNRVYGEVEWLVYGCVDGKMLVFVTSAFPFYFLSYVRDGGRRLYGEGNAPREATRPAYEDLARLAPADFEALLDETRAIGDSAP
jgi:hypothetical protein